MLMKCVVPEICTIIFVLCIKYAMICVSALGMHDNCTVHDVCKMKCVALEISRITSLVCIKYAMIVVSALCIYIDCMEHYICNMKCVVPEMCTMVLVLCIIYATKYVPHYAWTMIALNNTYATRNVLCLN